MCYERRDPNIARECWERDQRGKTMAEYIERDALIADMEKRYCNPCEAEGKDYNHIRCRSCWVDDAMGEIENALDVDVAPVVHGRWEAIYYTRIHNGATSFEGFMCSVCKKMKSSKFAFCPNCGARMDGTGDV